MFSVDRLPDSNKFWNEIYVRQVNREVVPPFEAVNCVYQQKLMEFSRHLNSGLIFLQFSRHELLQRSPQTWILKFSTRASRNVGSWKVAKNVVFKVGIQDTETPAGLAVERAETPDEVEPQEN